MKCKSCGSKRIVSISGKTSDCFSLEYFGKEYNGYVPYNIQIGGGDYIDFSYCAECGKIQGDFPIPEHIKEIN